VKGLVAAENCPTKAACDSVGMARSTYYYRSQRRDESQIGTDLEKLAGQYPKYGTRRMMHQLRRAPYFYQINRKRVQRIMREKRLLRPVKRARYRTTNSQHPYPRYPNLMQGLEVVRPEQAWVSDNALRPFRVTYIRLGQGFVFLAVIMDVFTRAIRGWNLSRSLDVDLTLTALQNALSLCIPEVHHD
jgi:putative transposase